MEKKKQPKKVYARNYYVPGIGHVKAGDTPTQQDRAACRKAGYDIEKLLK